MKRRFYDLRFYQDHSIGPYQVDFYCPQLKLIIELANENSTPASDADSKRQFYLYQHRITVISITPEEIIDNLDGWLEELRKQISTLAYRARN